MIKLIKCLEDFNEIKSDTHSMICFLNEKSMIDDKKCRKFMIFCANQIWDLLEDEEKDIVNLSQQYVDGIITNPKDIYSAARILSRKALAQPKTLEGKFNASKAAIAAGTGICDGQPKRSLYRAMDRAAYEVMVLHTMNETKSGDDFINPSPEYIQSIGFPYCQAQVVKLKELFGN